MNTQVLPLYILISILIMLVLALAFIYFLNLARQKITQSQLKEKELEMDFQKNLLLNTVKTKENERNRIAKELHDDVSSHLGIINLNLHVLKKKIPPSPELLKIIDQIDMSLRSSTERARSISHELLPITLQKFGLHHALIELADSINLTQVVDIEIKNDHLLKLENDFKRLHVYRIIQELVNNTLKYAKAKKIIILFEENGDELSLTYSDDGIGFDIDSITEGLGMSNIQTRVSLLDGIIQVDTSKGKGFKCVIKFPNHD